MGLTAVALDANLETIDRLRSAKSVKALVSAGTQWATSNGFDHWVYGVGAPATPRFLGTFPKDWIRSASVGERLRDPLLLMAAPGSRPVAWDLSTQHGIPPMLTVTRQRLLKESWDHGLRSGITVPARSPDGRASCYLAASNATSVDPRTRHSQKPLAILFLTYFQRELARVAGYDLFEPYRQPLAPRELECLKWASCGKTSNEIGRLVGIAPVTVNFHIKNAAKKLGAKGRFPAIQIAFKQQLFDFDD